MAVINVSSDKVRVRGSRTHELTRENTRVNTASLYALRGKNQEAIDTLNKYNEAVGNGGWLSSDDIASYRSALDNFVSSSNRLRELNSFFSDDYVDDSEDWQKTVSSMEDSYRGISDFYSKWKDEDEYNKSRMGWLDPEADTNATTVAQRKAQYQNNADRISEIEKSLPWYGSSVLPNFVENWLMSDEQEAMRNELESLKAENKQYERTQKVLDDYYKPVTNEFLANGAFRDYSNASREELWNYDMTESEGSLALNSGGYFDDYGNIRNARGEIVRAANAPVVEDKLGLYLSASDDEIIEAFNELSIGNGNYTNTWANYIQEGDVNGWRYLKKEELNIYYDLLKTEGQEAAYRFLDAMTTELTRRASQKLTDDINKTDGLEQVLLNLASVPMSVFGGLTSFVDDTAHVIQGQEINPYSRAHMFQNAASDIREKTAIDIDKLTGGVSIPFLDFSAGDAYQSLMSGADSLLGAAIGGNAYGVLMGMGSASSTAKDLFEKGASTEQIVAGGLLAGAAEMVFEKLSIDKLVKNNDVKSIKGIIVNMLKQGGVEASEEAFTEIANTITNYLVMGSQSDWVDLPTFVKNVVNAALGGFLSGGGTGGLYSTAQKTAYDSQVKKYGQKIIDKGGVEALQDAASKITDNKAVTRLADKVAKKIKAKNVGKLAITIQNVTDAKDRTAIAADLESRGLTKEEAAKVTDFVIKTSNGYNASAQEIAEIEKITEKLPDASDINITEGESIAEAQNNGYIDKPVLTGQASAQAVPGGSAVKNASVNQSAAEGKFAASEAVSKNDGATAQTIAGVQGGVSEAVQSADMASVRGRATMVDSDGEVRSVKVQKVASIDNGVISLELEDGQVVKASDVELDSESDALLYDAVTRYRMSAQDANAFIKTYYDAASDMPIEHFTRGFGEAYTYGKYGISEKFLTASDSIASELSEPVRNFAYNLGKKEGERTAAENQKEVDAKKEASKGDASAKNERKKGGWLFYDGINKSGLTERQRVSAKSLEVVAKALGVNIHLFESSLDSEGNRTFTMKNGKVTRANGWYDVKTGDIYIDINSGVGGDGVMLFTAAHELVHDIAVHAPAKFKILADFLMEQYGKKGVSVDMLVQAQIDKAARDGRTIDYDTAYEEVIADSCESLLSDGEVIKKLAELKARDEGLFEKIKSFITKLVARIKKAYAGMKPDSYEGRIVSEMVDEAERLKELFADALLDASEARASGVFQKEQMSERINSENSGILYSDRTDIVDENGNEYDHVIELDYKIFNKVKRSGKAYIDFIRNNLINQKITVYNSNGESEIIEFAKENERVRKDGSINFRRVLGELEQARNELKKLVILNSKETVEISLLASHKNDNTHQWLDKNGWDTRRSYVLTNDGTLYPVELFIAKARDGRNILYDANVKIKEGIGIDKIATSLRSKNNARQAVKVPVPSGNEVYHKSEIMSSDFDEKNFSDRDSESFSSRSLLANALESAAKDGEERKLLKEYQAKISELDKKHAELSEIREKADKIRYTKGRNAEQTQEMRDLYSQAKELAKDIDAVDRQLLELEALQPIKDVLNREKSAAYNRAKQKGKKALAEYREKAAKAQQEMKEHYQEARKKAVEGREKTAMRHKIRNVVNDLNQYLLKGTKDKHVPIELQKAVALALDSVNMDTVGAEERIAKLKDELMRAESPEKAQEISRKIDNISSQGGNLKDKLTALKAAYDGIINSDDPIIANSHDEVISNKIESVKDAVGETALRDMSLDQLNKVYEMYKMVLKSVRDANKTFLEEKGEAASELAREVIDEEQKLKQKPRLRKDSAETVEQFSLNNLKPVYLFNRLGSKVLNRLFGRIRAAEDVWAADMAEANLFREAMFKKYNYKSWDFDKKYDFMSTTGHKFSLSLDQIMSLYALSKRDQAAAHLEIGGFAFDGLTEVKDEKNKLIKYKLKDPNAYNLSDKILADIVKTLDDFPGAREFVDEMQKYLAETMGEKGNEVSLQLYDIKLFKDKNYFPLIVSDKYLARAKEKATGDAKIKNRGFTKETKPNANSPVVLSSFMDVWASHVNDMCMYHAFTLPLEDFYRVYNFKVNNTADTDALSVVSAIEGAHGNAAVKCIDQLLKDINGGAVSDPTETISKKMISSFKKAAVLLSLSVVIQQPSAIVRAQAYISPKYFVGGKVSDGKHAEVWAEIKKYAPVAIIKEMGSFDTGMGRGAVEWLKGDKSAMDTFDDIVSRPAAYADELTWCAIWNAVKRETMHNNPNLNPKTEEFLKAAGERFTEVIVKTQVYDSTLSRSANMRSKSAFMQMATAFMAEPTTSINMLEDAFRSGNKKFIGRVIGAVYGSVLLNSILVSFIYALRDDDDDETFIEKYFSHLATELIDGINPLTYIPFVKDIWSVAQGFDVERADMTLITNTFDAFQQLVKVATRDTSSFNDEERAEHNKALAEAIFSITDGLAALKGIPLKNCRREVNGFINGVGTIIKDVTGRPTTWGSLLDVVGDDAKNSLPVLGWLPDESRGDKLYYAIISGDEAYEQRLRGTYKNESTINSAIRRALRDNDKRIKEAAIAKNSGDNARYEAIALEILNEGFFRQSDIAAAINAEINELNKDNKPEVEVSDKEVGWFTIDDYFVSIHSGDKQTADHVREEIINTYIANGRDRDEAEAAFDSSLRSSLRKYDSRIRDAAMAQYKLDVQGRIAIQKEILAEKNFSWDNIRLAVNAEAEFIYDKIKDAKKAMDSGNTKVYDDIIEELIERGYPEDFILKALKK